MYNVQKAGNLIDNNSGRAYEVFKFTTVEGKTRHVRIEREYSRDIKHIYRVLLKANADLPSEEHAAHEIIRASLLAQSGQTFCYAAQFGWQRGRASFMLGSRHITAGKAAAQLLPPMWADEIEAPLHTAGSLKKWQKLVAGRLSGSVRLDVLLISAFAAPLVRLTAQPNPGLNFVGMKWGEFDIASALVGSMLGQHADSAVSEWWVSPGTLLRRAHQFNDMLFVAGDLLNSPERIKTRRQHEQLLSLRRGRFEGSAIGSASAACPSQRWRGIFVTMLQHRVWQPKASGVAQGAPLCLDIPPSSRLSALIDLPGPSATVADLQPVALRLVRLADHARKQRGTPMRQYIQYLVTRRSRLAKQVARLCAEFSALQAHGMSDESGSPALSCFALLYAGGCLAIEAGVLPWKRKRIAASLGACLSAIMRHDLAERQTPARIRGLLRAKLTSTSIVRRNLGRGFGPDQHDGYYELIGGRRRYTVHATAFRNWFGSPARCGAALTWLHKKGLLVMGAKPHSPTSYSTDWAERTPRWPDGRVQKSFVFFKPPRKHRPQA